MDGILKRARVQQREQRRATRKPLERGGKPPQRLLAFGQPRAQHRTPAIDQAHLRLVAGDTRFGLLDARGDAGGFARGFLHRFGGARGFGFKLFGTRAGGLAFRLRPGHGLADFRFRRIEPRLLLRARAHGKRKQRHGKQAETWLHATPLTRSMIGMTSQNAGGAPQLFGQHGARQHVRPGHCAEGDQQISLAAQGIAMPIGGADVKARLAHAFIAPLAQQGGEFLGG
mgnify:CR=1 FL=1